MSEKPQPPQRTAVSLLSEILDILRADRELQVPSNFVYDFSIKIPANTTVERVLDLPTPGAYVYLTGLRSLPVTIYNQSDVILFDGSKGYDQVVISFPEFIRIRVRIEGDNTDTVVSGWVASRPVHLTVWG